MTKRGAGGTPGGIGQFFLGLFLTGIAMWMFLDRVSVFSNFSSMWGGHTGLLLLPLGLGLALLFFSARSWLGWILTIGSVATVFVAIVTNLTLMFMPTAFWQTAGMITLLFVGLVMMARSLRAAA